MPATGVKWSRTSGPDGMRYYYTNAEGVTREITQEAWDIHVLQKQAQGYADPPSPNDYVSGPLEGSVQDGFTETNGNDNGGGNGIDHGQTSIANVAGYWTVGVAKGMAIMFVPVVVVSVAVGFMTRVVKVGTRIGGA